MKEVQNVHASIATRIGLDAHLNSLIMNVTLILRQNRAPVVYNPFIVTLMSIKCW